MDDDASLEGSDDDDELDTDEEIDRSKGGRQGHEIRKPVSHLTTITSRHLRLSSLALQIEILGARRREYEWMVGADGRASQREKQPLPPRHSDRLSLALLAEPGPSKRSKPSSGQLQGTVESVD